MTYKFTSVYLDYPIVKDRVFDIFEPMKTTRDTAIFFIHGGGWRMGARSNYHSLMQAFNDEGYLCASTDYRPADNGLSIVDQITDIRQAYDEFVSYLKQNDRLLNIFICGSSAGAHLTELLAYAAPGTCGENLELINEWVKPSGIAAICAPITLIPWDDIFPGIAGSIRNAMGTTYEENHEFYKKLSPESYLSSDLCPSFFLCAEDEYIFPNRLVDAFVFKLKEKGVKAKCKVYPRVEHGFFYSLDRWQQQEAFKDIISFIESLINKNEKLF